MKSTVTIALLLVMLVQSFSKVFIVLDYQANKNYIAEFLCVNKAKPQMHCNGQCYLKKQLQKAEQQENQSTTPNLKHAAEITLFCQHLFSLPFTPVPLPVQHTFTYLPGVAKANLRFIFHPPQFTVLA
ncbi:hypothetical protein HUW51_15410 [Adhaeribacter swui]|uniref:Uncharacterized protein n=1 Tax=Adhaeribacter swui TaxID=2086471 RepID=A0A7G7GA57_9BACT|nr:hypothetical protein [Adhaeribacter swui]QNF34041.1 hypothetical protein HUW51_15410 [Adhaeribacter swui]